MNKNTLFTKIIILMIFTFVNGVSPPFEKDIKIKWGDCCRNHLCIENSCYFLLQRRSNWSAIRQRCQGIYPDWPKYVDIFQIRHKKFLEDISYMIKAYSYRNHEDTGPIKVWTSGVKCPLGSSQELTYFNKWISDDPFPEWLEEELGDSQDKYLDKNDGCKFLVFTSSTNMSQMKYEFQNQSARHSGVCEFILPEDIYTTVPTETPTAESQTTSPFVQTTSSTQNLSTKFFFNQTDTSTIQATDTLITNMTDGHIEKTTSKSTNMEKTTKTSTTVSTTVGTTTNATVTTTDNIRFCESKLVAGIQWPDTMAGITVNKSCPEGMTGYAQWTCDESTLQFIPAIPHVQECKHIWITDLEEHVQDGKDAVDISSELARETNQQNMSHGDITALVDLSVKILHLFSMQKEEEESMKFEEKPKPYVFTGCMVSSMSNILRAEIKDAWEVLPTSHQIRAASKILEIVSVIGSHLSCLKKSRSKLQYTISSENIGLQTFILNEKETAENDPIVFPQKAEGVETKSSLVVPANLAWKKPFAACKNHNTAVGVIYKHVGYFLKNPSLSDSETKVVTKVISFAMNNNSRSMPLPNGKRVTIILKHNIPQNLQQHLRCVFWNFSKQNYGAWDDSGCIRESSNESHVVCSCNHLTNFAVLMDINNNIEGDLVLSMMTYICCGMSCVSLIITLFCFLSIRALHGRRSIITGNLCLSLLFANLLIIFGLDQTEHKIVCGAIAGFLHFWILSAFCWMLIEGYHLYKMVVLVFERGYVLPVKAYYFFAYGLPLIIVSISVGITAEDYVGEHYCWLASHNGLIWSFVGPACAIILINIVIFILTLRSASNVRIKREQTTVKKIKNWARGSMSVMCLLGLTWCLGLFYIDKKLKVFSYIFTVLNGMQGVFIFFFHILLNDKSSSFCRCKDSKKEKWKQTSSNRMNSKLSTRTSLNSMGCVGCNVQVLNPNILPNEITLQYSNNENDNRSKFRSKKNHIFVKERAQHTVSVNGISSKGMPRHFKTRSQSFPEDRGHMHQHISYINTSVIKTKNAFVL